MILWINKKVANHLDCFRVLDVDMLFLACRLHEILMNQFPNLAPRLAIIHHQKVISLGNQTSNYGRRPVAVYVALLIQQIPDQFAVRDDQCGICESFQTENPTEPSRPFG